MDFTDDTVVLHGPYHKPHTFLSTLTGKRSSERDT